MIAAWVAGYARRDQSKQIRLGEKGLKGYLRSDFIEAWDRYLPPSSPKAKQAKQAKQVLKNRQKMFRMFRMRGQMFRMMFRMFRMMFRIRPQKTPMK